MLALVMALCLAQIGDARNLLYAAATDGTATLAGVPVRLDPPTLRDDMTAGQQRAALVAVAGSKGKADDLLRDSVSAGHVLKIKDLHTTGPTIVRGVDLWFAVRADLDAIDPADALGKARGGKPVEAGNMRFDARELTAVEVKDLDLKPPAGAQQWFLKTDGRLLDRIGFGSTDRLLATRGEGSRLIASSTLGGLVVEGTPLAGTWKDVSRPTDAPKPYAGGMGYAKLSALKGYPGVVLVESHAAFSEPRGWFDGAPILRSKIGLVAQDQVRSLRRELANPKR